MSGHHILIVLLSLSTLLFSCKKEQPAFRSLEEDCTCAKEVSAEFLMEEIWGFGFSWEKRAETDTIFYDQNVCFSAKEDNAEYTWYIGNEVAHEQNVCRYFGASLINQDIKITLVVKKRPNSICKPNDDGYDSIVKFLHVSNINTESAFEISYPAIEGIYRVKENTGQDSIDIVIDTFDGGFTGGYTVKMFIPDGNFYDDTIVSNQETAWLYKRIWCEIMTHKVEIYKRENNKVFIQFIGHELLNEKDYTYLGRRL